MNLDFRETQHTLISIKTKIIIEKVLKVKDKDIILKAQRKKLLINYKEMPIKLIAEILSKTSEARNQ